MDNSMFCLFSISTIASVSSVVFCRLLMTAVLPRIYICPGPALVSDRQTLYLSRAGLDLLRLLLSMTGLRTGCNLQHSFIHFYLPPIALFAYFRVLLQEFCFADFQNIEEKIHLECVSRYNWNIDFILIWMGMALTQIPQLASILSCEGQFVE